jgi:hypothetical protein
MAEDYLSVMLFDLTSIIFESFATNEGCTSTEPQVCVMTPHISLEQGKKKGTDIG